MKKIIIIILSLFLGYYFIVIATGSFHPFTPLHPIIHPIQTKDLAMRNLGWRTDSIFFCYLIGDDSAFKSSCFDSVAKDQNDISLCKSQECITGYAVLLDNPDLCWLLDFGNYRDSCFMDLAKKRKDFLLCDEVKSKYTRNSCYMELNFSDQNTSFCFKLKDLSKNVLQKCLSETRHDVNSCMEMKSYIDKNECIINVAVIKKDPSLCDLIEMPKYNISTLTGPTWEKDICMYEIAKASGDVSICRAITDKRWIKNCNQIIETNDQEISLEGCRQLKDGQGTWRAQSACFLQLAQKEKDQEICKQVKSKDLRYETSRDNCYRLMAIEMNDGNICEDIDSDNMKDWCKYDIARMENSETACQEIENKMTKHLCYFSLAKENINLNLCSKINDLEIKEKCIHAVALGEKDFSICDSITNDKDQDECYFDVAKATGELDKCKDISTSAGKILCVYPEE